MGAYRSHRNPLGLVVVTILLGWGSYHAGPLVWEGEIQMLPASLCGVAAIGALQLISEILMRLAQLSDWLSSHKATGKEGTARWGNYRELKKELLKNEGPFWGQLEGKPKKGIFIDFNSNAYVVGPAGSGKGHTEVIAMILSIMASKIITDFKPELVCICKKALELMEREVIVLNPFGLYTEIVGETQQLNPLDVVVDDLHRPNGLRDVFDDCKELNMQLYPEPTQSQGDDKYWRRGSRKLMSMAELIECMINVYDATLSGVSRLIEDRTHFEDNLRFLIGVDLEGKALPEGPLPLEQSEWAQVHDATELSEFLKTLRARASGILKLMSGGETKTFGSFVEGAEQALEPYSFGKLSSVLGRSSFDFDEIKNEKKRLNIFIVGDASRSEATEKFFGLMQWYMQLKLKRHPNKDVPVYLINDEASNYSIYGLASLMTWGRGFGIRTIQFFQNFPAYAHKHGKHALEILNSESEIKLFLPGQRDTSTIKRIAELLGQQSVMVARLSAEKERGSLHEGMSESARPLATEDEVRRSSNGILIVRQHRAFAQKPISYSEIHPWRSMVDINPHHGKPFLKKIKLRLKPKR